MIGKIVQKPLIVSIVIFGLYGGHKLILENILKNDASVRLAAAHEVSQASDFDVNQDSGMSSPVEGYKVLPSYLANVPQSSEELANHIRNKWIRPPFTGNRKLRDPNRTDYSQGGQSEFVDKLLNGRKNGFYIECGAYTGEEFSNSLFFEKSRDWSGLLIEANQFLFENMVTRRRHAYMLNACLSPVKKPMMLEFRTANLIGGLVDFMSDSHKDRISDKQPEGETIKVQCFPLFSVLRALNVTHVDYFSLDIEGAELDVLETFPFDEVSIDVISVEFFIAKDPEAQDMKLKQLKNLMVDRFGYKVANFPEVLDVVFVKNL